MKTKSHKRTLIILAKTAEQSDMGFYKTVLRYDSFIHRKAIVIMLPAAELLDDFLQDMPDDYTFSLLVHIGNLTMNRAEDGNEFADNLEKLPYYDKLKFEYTTREGNTNFNGRRAHHTQKLGKEEFNIDDLPLNKITDLRISGTSKRIEKSQRDFAILTALDEGENDIFSANMDSIRYNDQFTLVGKFIKNSEFKDYDQDFLLVKQKQMGMVDAALSACEIFHKYEPTWLVMGGVCGGRKSKVKMFDVVIPEKVFDFSFGSLEDGKFMQRDLDAKLNQDLINFLRTPNNKRRIKTGMVALIDTHNDQWTKYIQEAEIHFDVMACGPWVVKTENFIENLSQEKNNLIRALEMESYSIGRIGEFYSHSLKTLIVKSVMDYTDTKKEDHLVGLPVKKIAGVISYLCIRAILPLLKEYEQISKST